MSRAVGPWLRLYTDPKDSKPGAPVFNRVVSLRDGFAKK
jgi:hypothetical protein